MATTPPLQHRVHTPPTPLHGAEYDNYQPYTIRKSTRSTVQRVQRAAQTPPPASPFTSSSSRSRKSLNKNGKSSSGAGALTYSPPSSTQTSPQKKVPRDMESQLQGGAGLSGLVNGSSTAASSDVDHKLSLAATSSNNPAHMLPTPAKTPLKKRIQPASGISSAARVLFPIPPHNAEEAMRGTRKKERRRRKHIGFSLENSIGDDDTDSQGKIEIFTDSKDKVPELDDSENNPFYVKPGQVVPPTVSDPTRSSNRRKTQVAVQSSAAIEESFNRDEGMIYVFRGKKIFRKFPREDEEHGHMTRASVKPRLLFPPTSHVNTVGASHNMADEEAVTDIENPQDSEMTDVAEDTEEGGVSLVTPVKAIFTPASPPLTGHATRSATKKASEVINASSPLRAPEPITAISSGGKGKKRSPFDEWKRTKAGASVNGKGKKREGGVLIKEGSGKKAKSMTT